MNNLSNYLAEAQISTRNKNVSNDMSIINWIKERYIFREVNETQTHGSLVDDPEPYITIRNGIVDINLTLEYNIKLRDRSSITNGQFKFGHVQGFSVWNMDITTLDGCPEVVDQDFDCDECKKIKNLVGGPLKVGKVYSCKGCTSLTNLNGAPEYCEAFRCMYCTSLKTLEGAPREIRYGFNCTNCTSLKTLEGAPEKAGKDFMCNDCKNLISLEGAPKEVGGTFYCNNCDKLNSLSGAPEHCWSFQCQNCKSLTSLAGGPKMVDSIYNCTGCRNLTSVKGLPIDFKGNLTLKNTGIKSTQDIPKTCKRVRL